MASQMFAELLIAIGMIGLFALETTVMKWQHIGFVCIFVSGALREDTYGNSGFHIISSLKDGFQSLFDVFSVEEETVEIPHPVGKQRVTFHFFLCNITGTDWAAAVGQ